MLSLSTTLLGLVAIGMVSAGTLPSDSMTGYELISVTPQTEAQLAFISSFDIIGDNELDFWTPPMVNVSGQILVPPGTLAVFKAKMHEQGIPWAVETSDVAKLLEESIAADMEGVVGMDSGNGNGSFHTAYHSYDKIREFLRSVTRKYPRNTHVYSLPHRTHEGRLVYAIKLTGNDNGKTKEFIVVEGGIHAREWISPAVLLFTIDKLLEGYHGGNAVARDMLNKYDWHFVPVTNPDGYTYTRTTPDPSQRKRLWRKNRRQIGTNTICYGVDLNRNFDVAFGKIGVSTDRCSEIYPGPYAFSEAESENIKYIVRSTRGKLASYLEVHAFAQLILLPWGYAASTSAADRPSNYYELLRVATLMAKAIKQRHGKTYRVGQTYELLNYAVGGASSDWALSENPGAYTMALELRPSTDVPGFLLPASQIIATGEEFLASIEVLATKMQRT